MATIKWNNSLRLILSDVDETVADLYTAATPEICRELEKILEQGTVVFFITGQSIKSVQWRITDHVKSKLRKKVLVGHCSGAEVWGFDESGYVNAKPFYSLYENALTENQKKRWRDIVNQIIKEFKLQVYPATPLTEFKSKVGNNPLAIMLEDRGPQITLEVINGYDLTPEQEKALEISVPNTHGNLDLRVPIVERIDQLLQENNLPISPRLAGVFAIDLAIKGVSKTTAIKYILGNEEVLRAVGLAKERLKPDNIEVWGDKFSVIRGGTDRHMSEALPEKVRSITFREENPAEFLEGYNTVVWGGQKHLHEGLLEFLISR
ncbi:MAG: hypothetical protein Q7S23_02020 [bacterium]|nr:hypothetical protein [bacterium]